MPSPFPGMDPFIEIGHWQTFHNRFVSAIGDALVPQIRPAYTVDIGQDIYVVEDDAPFRALEPDIAITVTDDPAPSRRSTVAATLAPLKARIPLTRRRTQRLIELRDSRSNKLVTVIELLSPTNTSDSRGRKKYIKKRQAVVGSHVNLVEIHLLRAARRLPLKTNLPKSDYSAVVCRSSDAPAADAYAWSLRDPLPTIPIPLRQSDNDVTLNLQQTFEEVYDRLGLDYKLVYTDSLRPPVRDADEDWISTVLAPVLN